MLELDFKKRFEIDTISKCALFVSFLELTDSGTQTATSSFGPWHGIITFND
jgi:hypothetical protein